MGPLDAVYGFSQGATVAAFAALAFEGNEFGKSEVEFNRPDDDNDTDLTRPGKRGSIFSRPGNRGSILSHPGNRGFILMCPHSLQLQFESGHSKPSSQDSVIQVYFCSQRV